ncbi:MAG: 4Fe-4S binding protein [Desulfurococcales archaeon]|nr:4Fe-4S binding protein [Desulfurococcales archaeon]
MVKIIIDQERCDLCRLCIDYCPAYVFSIDDNKIVVEEKNCIECYGCIPLCPKKAIDIIPD